MTYQIGRPTMPRRAPPASEVRTNWPETAYFVAQNHRQPTTQTTAKRPQCGVTESPTRSIVSIAADWVWESTVER